jgi:hypothetical protein
VCPNLFTDCTQYLTMTFTSSPRRDVESRTRHTLHTRARPASMRLPYNDERFRPLECVAMNSTARTAITPYCDNRQLGFRSEATLRGHRGPAPEQHLVAEPRDVQQHGVRCDSACGDDVEGGGVHVCDGGGVFELAGV